MEAEDSEGEREQETGQSYKPPPSDILPSPPKGSATFPKQHHQLAIQERPGFLSLVHTDSATCQAAKKRNYMRSGLGALWGVLAASEVGLGS